MTNRVRNSELIVKTAEGLNSFGAHYGDILLASERLLPDLTIIRKTRFVKNQSNILAGGLDGNGNPVVHLGLGGGLTQGVRERIVSRHELSVHPQAKYDEIFQRIIFGHELGHVLQADDSFEAVFGAIDKTTYRPEAGYAAYINSDKEMNADFISAYLLGNTALGQSLEFSPPTHNPIEWREWAQTRRL